MYLFVEKERESKYKKPNRNLFIAFNTINMAQGQQLLVLSMIAIVLLITLSKCNSYPLFNELSSMYKLIKIFQRIIGCFFFQF